MAETCFILKWKKLLREDLMSAVVTATLTGCPQLRKTKAPYSSHPGAAVEVEASIGPLPLLIMMARLCLQIHFKLGAPVAGGFLTNAHIFLQQMSNILSTRDRLILLVQFSTLFLMFCLDTFSIFLT